jgi:hypothetical protein
MVGAGFMVVELTAPQPAVGVTFRAQLKVGQGMSGLPRLPEPIW